MTGIGTACGLDFLTASDSVDGDGDVHLSVTFTGDLCTPGFYPAVRTQPSFSIFPAGSVAPLPATSIGSIWAVSTTTQYLYSAPAGAGGIDLSSTILASSIDVEIPASIVANWGAGFKWAVTNSCRSHPTDAFFSDGDIAPESGLFTFGVDTPPPPVDLCPNLAGVQGTVPAGMAVVAGTCVGTSGANTLTGTSGADTINAQGGNDKVYGLAGNDFLLGGLGADLLDGGVGNDRLGGDAGNDILRGAAGADKPSGGAGNDSLNGGAGRDALNGGTGNDTIDARDTRSSSGKDTVVCGAGRDTVRANQNDVVARDCERVIRSA